MVTDIVGCIKKGTLAELPPHGTYLSDYLYYVTTGVNQGDLYWDNGTAWVMLQGATKAEVLQNKNIDPTLNTINGLLLDPFTSQKRQGFINPGLTAASSLSYALKGLPSVGSYSLFHDPVEGYVSRFSTSAIVEMGWYSNVTPFLTRRAHNPRLKIRMKTSTTSNFAMWVGFGSLGIQNVANAPLPLLSHGIVIGCGSGFSANYNVVRNNGANDVGVAVSVGVARDAIFHTYEIFVSDSGAPTVMFDNTNVVIPNSSLPFVNTDMMLYIHYWSRDTVAKTFDIARGYFESDFV